MEELPRCGRFVITVLRSFQDVPGLCQLYGGASKMYTFWKLLHTAIKNPTYLGNSSMQLSQTCHILEAAPYSGHRPDTSWKLFHTADTDLAHLGSSSIQLTQTWHILETPFLLVVCTNS
jgi:hypothetical protein